MKLIKQLAVLNGSSYEVMAQDPIKGTVLLYNPDIHTNAIEVFVEDLDNFSAAANTTEVKIDTKDTEIKISVTESKKKEDIYDPERFKKGDRVHSLNTFRGIVTGIEQHRGLTRIICRSLLDHPNDRKRYAYLPTELRLG